MAALMNLRRAAVASLLCVVASGCQTSRPPPKAPGHQESQPPAGGACRLPLSASPFENDEATHVLLANFYGPVAADSQFADGVSRHIDLRLKQFRDEELPRMPMAVSPESVEFRRLHCFVESHSQADEVAAALDADLVIWGQAFCNITPELEQRINVEQDITTGEISGSGNEIGRVNVKAPKPYSVCPSATLHRFGGGLRRASSLDLGSLAHLDLPTLSSSAPFQLVNFTLGLHFYERGQPWIAARFFEKSVQHVLSPTDKNLAPLYGYLGNAFLQLPGGAPLALKYNQAALDRLSATHSGSTLQTSLMSNMGRAYLDQADFSQAKGYFEKALRMDEQLLGPEHPNIARHLTNLAQLLKETNRIGEAEPLILRALAIDQKSFGPHHPTVGADLSNLALLLWATNRLGEAERLMRQALAIGEKGFGPDHPSVAINLTNLAQLLKETNRVGEAEPLMRRALVIDEKSFGSDHPTVAIRLAILGQLLKATNRLDEAEPLMRRALVIDEKSFGSDHPTVAADLSNLAALLELTNRLDDAEPLILRALVIDEKSFGPDHPSVARDLNNLAALLQATNRLGEAEPLILRALVIDQTSFGPDHPLVARDLVNLAALLQATNRLGEAEPLMRRALGIVEVSLGVDHPWTIRAKGRLDALLSEKTRISGP